MAWAGEQLVVADGRDGADVLYCILDEDGWGGCQDKAWGFNHFVIPGWADKHLGRCI
jgi:hypothetical protein